MRRDRTARAVWDYKIGGFVALARQHRANGSVAELDAGFTLIELVIVMVILPIVVGGIALAIVSVFNLQGSVTNRASDASDAQVVSTNFENDVHSAQELTAYSSATPRCGTSGTPLLGLEWGLNQAGTYNSVVTYASVQSGSTYSLVREFCASGASSTPTDSTYVSHDISSLQQSPTITPTCDSASSSGALTCVTFEGAAEVASVTTTWTMGFTTSSTGALVAGNTITVTFPSGFVVPSGATIAVPTGFSGCTATETATGQLATITLANASGKTCSLAASTAATLTIAGITNPGAGSQAAIGFSVKTTKDTSASPNQATTITTSGWMPAIGIASVTFPVAEPASSYAYTLVAVPATSASSGQLANVASATPGCNFATPGTGTYAQTLCFVDFSPLSTQAESTTATTACPEGGQSMSAPIADTPDTLTFCLFVDAVVQPSGSLVTVNGSTQYVNNTSSCAGSSEILPICAATVPTYYDAPTSSAFLGNNGFYMGIPGRPALYTSSDSQTTTLEFTNIQVLDSNGNPATDWDLVTGDAESTDPGESITWSTCSTSEAGTSDLPPATACSASTTNAPDLALLLNSASSSIGNACAYPSGAPPQVVADTAFLGTWLTGLNTNTVECAASVSSDKTGTVMLKAPTPTTLTATLVGSGLQAIFVGLLLPS